MPQASLTFLRHPRASLTADVEDDAPGGARVEGRNRGYYKEEYAMGMHWHGASFGWEAALRHCAS